MVSIQDELLGIYLPLTPTLLRRVGLEFREFSYLNVDIGYWVGVQIGFVVDVSSSCQILLKATAVTRLMGFDTIVKSTALKPHSSNVHIRHNLAAERSSVKHALDRDTMRAVTEKLYKGSRQKRRRSDESKRSRSKKLKVKLEDAVVKVEPMSSPLIASTAIPMVRIKTEPTPVIDLTILSSPEPAVIEDLGFVDLSRSSTPEKDDTQPPPLRVLESVPPLEPSDEELEMSVNRAVLRPPPKTFRDLSPLPPSSPPSQGSDSDGEPCAEAQRLSTQQPTSPSSLIGFAACPHRPLRPGQEVPKWPRDFYFIDCDDFFLATAGAKEASLAVLFYQWWNLPLRTSTYANNRNCWRDSHLSERVTARRHNRTEEGRWTVFAKSHPERGAALKAQKKRLKRQQEAEAEACEEEATSSSGESVHLSTSSQSSSQSSSSSSP